MVSQVTKLPGASTAVLAYWQSKAVGADWQCAMRVLHGDDWKRKLDSRFTTRRRKKKAAKDRRRLKKTLVKVGKRWYSKDWQQERIKQERSNLRKELRKRPATNKPSNMKLLEDWLQKHDFPSRYGKTKQERRLGEFVHAQKQAYVGNRQPYLTMRDIRKLEALPGWTFPLPKFGEMLTIVESMPEDPGSLKNVTVQLCPPSLSERSNYRLLPITITITIYYYSSLPIAIYFYLLLFTTTYYLLLPLTISYLLVLTDYYLVLLTTTYY